MFGSRPLRRSEGERVLVLLGALAVTLLVALGAHAGTPRGPLESLERDLGALRVQLEQVEALLLEDHRAVALGTDIGDGSPAFQRQALTTILRSAHRRLDRLGADPRQIQAEGQIAQLDRLRLGLLELQVRFGRLTGASDAAQAAKARAAAVVLLEELDQVIDLLVRSAQASAPATSRSRDG
jgi:hypothetical protein